MDSSYSVFGFLLEDSVVATRRVAYLLVADGASEKGYYKWVDKVAKRLDVSIHINVDEDESGSPYSTLERAKRITSRGKRYAAIDKSRVFLVVDAEDKDENEMEEFKNAASRYGFTVFVQRPCFECWLVAHFDGSAYKPSLSCKNGLKCVRKHWPQYKKGFDCNEYDKVLKERNLRDASKKIEELRLLLRKINLHEKLTTHVDGG